MDLGIKGRRAFVSGGTTGIGEAISKTLAAEGVQVAVSSRSSERVGRFNLEMNTSGEQKHRAFLCDISEEGGPTSLIERINEEFGEIDILVNNAGSSMGIADPYCSMADWRKILRINLEVPVEFCNAVLPHMKKQDWGRIVNIISLAGMENSGPVTYCASKAALTAYTRSMGRVLAIESSNVVMTALAPGVVVTKEGHWGKKHAPDSEHAVNYLKERCPLGRFGEVEEISPMVAHLCSNQATFCHGGIFIVDGGQTKHFMYTSYLS